MNKEIGMMLLQKKELIQVESLRISNNYDEIYIPPYNNTH